MKKLALVSLLASTPVFAFQTKVIGDEVYFEQGKVGSLLEVCFDGEKIRSLTPETYCTGFKKVWVRDNGAGGQSDGNYEYVCTGKNSGYLTAPLTVEYDACLDRDFSNHYAQTDGPSLGKCLEYGKKTYTHELAGTLKVKVTAQGGTKVVSSYEIDYSVPACN